MPKASSRRRTELHGQSVKLHKRDFSGNGQVEHVEVGREAEKSADEIIQSISKATPSVTKKEKQQMKKDAFIARLKSPLSPYYSKSHARRAKRKEREQLASGLGELDIAIAEVEHNDAMPTSIAVTHDDSPEEKPKQAKAKSDQIGEGKSAPLTKAQRKNTLRMEQLRYPLILKTPEFASNPFSTIRTHAENTLLKHTKPS